MNDAGIQIIDHNLQRIYFCGSHIGTLLTGKILKRNPDPPKKQSEVKMSDMPKAVGDRYYL